MVVADATTNVCDESTAFISGVKTDKDDLGVAASPAVVKTSVVDESDRRELLQAGVSTGGVVAGLCAELLQAGVSTGGAVAGLCAVRSCPAVERGRSLRDGDIDNDDDDIERSCCAADAEADRSVLDCVVMATAASVLAASALAQMHSASSPPPAAAAVVVVAVVVVVVVVKVSSLPRA